METLKTAFYQRYGGYTVKLLPETSADNVKMGQDTVADRILALERGGAALPEAAAAREAAQEALQLVASQSARLEELEAGVEVAGQRLALVDDKADEALEAAQGAVAKVLQNSRELAAAAAEIGGATARLQEAAEVCADLSGRTGAIGEQAEAATAAVQGFAADLAEQAEGLGACQSGLATQGAELTSLAAGLEEAETAQAALTGELADLQGSVDSLEEAAQQLNADLSACQTGVSQLTGQASSLESRLSDVESEAGEQAEALTALQAQAQTLEAADASLAAGLAGKIDADQAVHLLSQALDIHVNADHANASDTEGLNQGRGLSEDMPFASFAGAFSWATGRYAGLPWVTIKIHSAIEIPSLYPKTPFFPLKVVGVGARRAVTLTSSLLLYWGHLTLENLAFSLGAYEIRSDASFHHTKLLLKDCSFTGSSYLVRGTYASSSLYLEGANTFTGTGNGTALEIAWGAIANTHWAADTSLTFNGSFATLVKAYHGGLVNLTCAMNGNATGRRYYAYMNGSILTGGKGPNAIPGNQAGDVDATSVYA